MIKVILSNKFEVTELALRFALETYPEIEVIGSAKHEDQIFALCSQTIPDVILYELFNDTLKDLEVAWRIHQVYHNIKLIVLSHMIELSSADLEQVGCSACVYMTTPLEELVALMHALVGRH